VNLNLTLLGQIIFFVFFCWVTLKFIWPPLMSAMEARRQKIADGLNAAERGREALAEARMSIASDKNAAQQEAQEILGQAGKRAEMLVEVAREKAKKVGDEIVAAAQSDIAMQTEKMKRALQARYVELVVAGAEKVLVQKIDAKRDKEFLEQMIEAL